MGKWSPLSLAHRPEKRRGDALAAEVGVPSGRRWVGSRLARTLSRSGQRRRRCPWDERSKTALRKAPGGLCSLINLTSAGTLYLRVSGGLWRRSPHRPFRQGKRRPALVVSPDDFREGRPGPLRAVTLRVPCSSLDMGEVPRLAAGDPTEENCPGRAFSSRWASSSQCTASLIGRFAPSTKKLRNSVACEIFASDEQAPETSSRSHQRLKRPVKDGYRTFRGTDSRSVAPAGT